MRVIRKFAVVAAIAATCAVAQAQEGLRDRDPVLQGAKKVATDLQSATAHYGPWYLLSRFQLSDLGYGQSYYTPTGDQSSGFSIGATAPQRLYFVPSRRVVLSAEAVPQYVWVDKGDASQFGYTTRGDAQFIFNHVYLDLFGTRSNELRPQTGEINRVVTVKERQAGVSGELKYSSRTSALFTAAYRDGRYPPDRLQPAGVRDALFTLDRTEHNYRLSVLHKTFPITSVILAGEQSEYAFVRASSRDAKRQYFGAGIVADTGEGTLHLEAGPGRLTFKQPGQKEFSGILVNASASRRLGERWRIGAALHRDLDFSIYRNNNYYILDRVGVSADWAVTRRLSMHFISDYGRDMYDVRFGTEPLRRDTISWNAIGWDYGVRRIRGGFDVGYYQRTTNVLDAEETDGIRMVVHLSFTP